MNSRCVSATFQLYQTARLYQTAIAGVCARERGDGSRPCPPELPTQGLQLDPPLQQQQQRLKCYCVPPMALLDFPLQASLGMICCQWRLSVSLFFCFAFVSFQASFSFLCFDKVVRITNSCNATSSIPFARRKLAKGHMEAGSLPWRSGSAY